MSLNPYLYFDGNCRTVFEFYKSVFGGEYAAMMKFSDGPPDMNVAETDKEKVMHVSLPVGTSMLMGSDVPSGTPNASDSNVHISFTPESREDCDAKFAKLSEGGQVTMELQETFWGSYFGNLTDKFGIHWMFNFPLS